MVAESYHQLTLGHLRQHDGKISRCTPVTCLFADLVAAVLLWPALLE